MSSFNSPACHEAQSDGELFHCCVTLKSSLLVFPPISRLQFYQNVEKWFLSWRNTGVLSIIQTDSMKIFPLLMKSSE